jgi:hypothetical protein
MYSAVLQLDDQDQHVSSSRVGTPAATHSTMYMHNCSLTGRSRVSVMPIKLPGQRVLSTCPAKLCQHTPGWPPAGGADGCTAVPQGSDLEPLITAQRQRAHAAGGGGFMPRPHTFNQHSTYSVALLQVLSNILSAYGSKLLGEKANDASMAIRDCLCAAAAACHYQRPQVCIASDKQAGRQAGAVLVWCACDRWEACNVLSATHVLMLSPSVVQSSGLATVDRTSCSQGAVRLCDGTV